MSEIVEYWKSRIGYISVISILIYLVMCIFGYFSLSEHIVGHLTSDSYNYGISFWSIFKVFLLSYSVIHIVGMIWVMLVITITNVWFHKEYKNTESSDNRVEK